MDGDILAEYISMPVPFLAGTTVLFSPQRRERHRGQSLSFLEISLGAPVAQRMHGAVDDDGDDDALCPTFKVSLYVNCDGVPDADLGPHEGMVRPKAEVALPRAYELGAALQAVLTPFVGVGSAWNLLLAPRSCWLRLGLGLGLHSTLAEARAMLRRWLASLSQDVAAGGGWRNYGSYDAVAHEWIFQADWFCAEARERAELICGLGHSQLFHDYVDKVRRDEQEEEKRRIQESMRELEA
mmetsp:Transcript_41126/g.128955  ORF Transcript_41126/g.128955 Transcript_41126/m.128955 type:complete len:240 (-) Transcript_41126:410-1129(-)